MKFNLRHLHPQSAFTLIEIAISLAIIGVALVGIIGVLPLGLNTQRDNRESTVINQDATIFIEAVRNGARGADDLANYVYAITNYQTTLSSGGTTTIGYDSAFLTNGLRIVGLLSTPEFMDNNFAPANPGNASYSNHVVACVRSISGPAVEKPPQDNQILQQDSFSYHIYCVNAPVAMDTNIFNLPANQRIYSDQLAANLHELRLTFLWPVLPNGNLPARPFHATFRTLVAGQVAQDADNANLYFYQPQSFTSAP